MFPEARFSRDSRLPAQEIDGQAVIVVPAKSEMHLLNEVGTFLWNELERPRSPEELARAVCEEFDISPDQARRDAETFLQALAEKGLVSRA